MIATGVLCVDRVPPTVNIYTPGYGSSVSGTTLFQWYAVDNDQVASLEVLLDGGHYTWLSLGYAYPYFYYDTHALPVGWHTFSLIAKDREGNTTRSDNQFYVANQVPAAGQVMLGDYLTYDGGGGNGPPGYYPGRYFVEPYDGSGGDWIWSNTGAKTTPVYLPNNPDPTHYQMRLGIVLGRCEGGSDGNVIHIYFTVDGTDYDWWDNGPAYTTIPALMNIGGGDSFWARRWQDTQNNTAFTLGVGAYYDFVVKSGYQS